MILCTQMGVGLLLWILVSLGSNLGRVKCIAMKIAAIFFFVFVFYKGFQQEEKIRDVIVIHNYLCMLQKFWLLCSHRDALWM